MPNIGVGASERRRLGPRKVGTVEQYSGIVDDVPVQTVDTPEVAARLLEAREYLGIPAEVVAEHLGIDVTAIEAGDQEISSEQLHQLCVLYRRPVDWVLTGTEPEIRAETLAAVGHLNDQDREVVLNFAKFLTHAGPPSTSH